MGNLGPYEVMGLRKDGATFPMEIRIKLMDYRGSKVRMAAIRDLSERRQAEEALRESEEKYRSLVESSIDGIAIVQGTEIKFANQALFFPATSARSHKAFLMAGCTNIRPT